MSIGNGADAQPAAPVGDQNIIRALAMFLGMAQRGELIGIALTGMTPGGDAIGGNFCPQTPGALRMMIGDLEALKNEVMLQLRAHHQTRRASPIIHPGPGLGPFGG